VIFFAAPAPSARAPQLFRVIEHQGLRPLSGLPTVPKRVLNFARLLATHCERYTTRAVLADPRGPN
jgi:hypothetical protein